jgi:hypothetical protein
MLRCERSVIHERISNIGANSANERMMLSCTSHSRRTPHYASSVSWSIWYVARGNLSSPLPASLSTPPRSGTTVPTILLAYFALDLYRDLLLVNPTQFYNLTLEELSLATTPRNRLIVADFGEHRRQCYALLHAGMSLACFSQVLLYAR